VLQPLELEAERAGGRLPAEVRLAVAHAARDAGLAACGIPREHGGQGLGLTELIAVHEQLGRVSNCLWALVPSPSHVLVHGDEAQRARYLAPAVRGELQDAFAVTEEAAGSDPRAIQAQAVRDGDRYLLSGRKWFVSGGERADVLIVLAWAVDGYDRQLTLFLVDRDLPGVEVAADPDYTHASVVRAPEMVFAETPLAASAVLGEPGRGLELTGEWFVEERALIAARCIGACERLLELGTAHALGRQQFGTRIFDHQAVSFPLADSAAEAAAARLLTYEVGRLRDAGADPRLVHAKASMAKLLASETAFRVADRVMQVFGGRGYMRDNPVERLWRGVRLDRIWEGTSEIHRLVVARGLERRGVARLLSGG
jgi:alkylation response protein AidB-like acyl-CoA dehydrogenase